jgi:RNA polymerase sigma factor for flagellar operon FliA
MKYIQHYEDLSGSTLSADSLSQYFPLVKKIAFHIKKRLPSHIDINDLLQSGMVGLIEAKKNYRTDMNAAFETYASIRIRGSIVDDLRKNSWTSRDTIKNMRRVSNAIQAIEQRHHRSATTEEIAKELGITLDEHLKLSQEISFCNVMSLEDVEEGVSFVDDNMSDPQREFMQDSLRQEVKKLLIELPEREQLVLSLYYVEEFTFKQIGEILELTEARVCQLHSQAIARVRSKRIIKEGVE